MRAVQIKISANQIFWILLIPQVVTVTLLTVRTTTMVSMQDAWISTLIGGAIGLLLTMLMIKETQVHPAEDVIISIRHLVGKWISWLILFPYFVFGLLGAGANLHEFISFVHLALFVQTPRWALITLFLGVVVYLTLAGGIEGIGRCAQFIGPWLIIIVIFVIVMNWDYMDVHRVIPIYRDSGWPNLLTGSAISSCFFSQTVLLLMLTSFTDNRRSVWTAAYASLTATLLTSASVLAVLTLFGPKLTEHFVNPFFEFARFISAMEFIENIDVIVVVFWMAGYFVTFATYLFAIGYGLSEWLQMKNWRLSVTVVAVVVFVESLIPVDMHISDLMVDHVGWTVGFVIHLFVAIIFLWTISRLKQHLRLI